MGEYAEKRAKYYDQVIAKYSSGMTAKEIIKTIPVGKSTVYRWVEEHLAKSEGKQEIDIVIPRTPASVAKTIKAMNAKVKELTLRLELAEKRNEQSEHIISLINEMLGQIIALINKSYLK